MGTLTGPACVGERFSPYTIPLHLVDRFVKTHSLRVFVETGTYTGTTVEKLVRNFEEIFTIELDQALYVQAAKRFFALRHVHVVGGDSCDALPLVLDMVGHRRALIWLDAYRSEGITVRQALDIHTSVRAELAALKAAVRRDHVIMIDDIDDFSGEHGYPTRVELVDLVREINPDYEIEILKVRRGVLVAYQPT